MNWLVDPLQLPFMQQALLAIVILAIPAGLLGSWIVLRGLAFFGHSAGTATFPALVIASAGGLPARISALFATTLFTLFAGKVGKGKDESSSFGVALVLVSALALGAVLASDVYASSASVDTLLFGSLIGVDNGDLLLCLLTALGVATVTACYSRRWSVSAFDSESAETLIGNQSRADWVLLLTVGFTTVAMLPTVGSLLIGSLLVTPAATAALAVKRLSNLYLVATAVALIDGTLGLLFAFHFNAPAGASIALIGAVVFLATAVTKNTLLKVRAGA